MKLTSLFICLLVLLMSHLNLVAQIRVVCVGNSITEGYGLTQPAIDSYPAQLGKLLGSGYSVLNCGVSARTLLKRGDIPYWNESKFTDAKNFDPQLVIISLGTNDSKPQNWDSHRSEFFSDYKDMVNAFRTNGKNPIIYVCLPPPAFVDNYGIRDEVIRNGILPLVDSIKKTLNTSKIDFYHKLLPYGSYFTDGVHPNVQGAAIMAQIAFSAIKDCPSMILNAYVNGRAVVQTNGATLSVGDSISFNPTPLDGTWRWTGSNNFSSSLRQITLRNIQFNQGGVYTATCTNLDGCKSSQDFMITLNGCAATVIDPFLQVNNGTWTNKATANLTAGGALTIGPHPLDNATWRWIGPCGFSSYSRQITLSQILNREAGDYTASYYNANGCKSTQVFTITVTGEDVCTIPIVPFVNVANVWKQQTSASVNSGASISFGPQPNDGGTWIWTGPNNFTSTSRDFSINNIKVSQAGKYTAKYTNAIGCSSFVIFNVTVDGVNELFENEEDSSIKLFPSQVSDIVTLTNVPANNSIKLMNLCGQVLLQTKSSQVKEDIKIDIRNLRSGYYLINIGNSREIKSLKLLKM